MSAIPLELVWPVLAVELVLLVVALVDCVPSMDTNGPKWLWVLLTVIVPVLGPMVYFMFGKKRANDGSNIRRPK